MDTNDRGMSYVRQPHGFDMGRTEQLTVLQPQGFVLPDQIPTVEVPGQDVEHLSWGNPVQGASM